MSKVTADDHKRRRHETDEIVKASMRFAQAVARRAEEGDTDALEGLGELAVVVEAATKTAAGNLHACGYSWAEIGAVLGVSRQAAHKRFGRQP